jgi:hypothetical protein
VTDAEERIGTLRRRAPAHARVAQTMIEREFAGDAWPRDQV